MTGARVALRHLEIGQCQDTRRDDGRNRDEQGDRLRRQRERDRPAARGDVGEPRDRVRRRQPPDLHRPREGVVRDVDRRGRGAGQALRDQHDRERAVRRAPRRERRQVVGIGRGRPHAHVPERAADVVVVAVHLDRLVGGRRGVGRRPARADVEPLAPEDAQHVRLGGGAVDVALGAPVVLGDGGLRVRVVLRHPLAHARDQVDLVVDPGLVGVARVPERAGRAVAALLHRGRDVVAELAALRVVVQAEDVQQAAPGRDLALAHLVEQPRHVVPAAVCDACRACWSTGCAPRPTAGRTRSAGSRASPTPRAPPPARPGPGS